MKTFLKILIGFISGALLTGFVFCLVDHNAKEFVNIVDGLYRYAFNWRHDDLIKESEGMQPDVKYTIHMYENKEYTISTAESSLGAKVITKDNIAEDEYFIILDTGYSIYHMLNDSITAYINIDPRYR